MKTPTTLALAAALLLCAWGEKKESPPAPAGDSGERKPLAIITEKLEPFECGTITKLHTLGGIFLASQPKP